MKRKYLLIIVFVFGAGIYLNTVPNSYAYDDFSVIKGNRFTTQGISGVFNHLFHDSFEGFTGQTNLFRGGRYRPLSLITFSIEYQFFGLNPQFSHFVNVVLFGLVCLILYMVLVRLLQDPLIFKKPGDYFRNLALMAALIFAAHPIHTEVVANIKGRDELMALLFGLLAWKSFLKYTDTGKNVEWLYGAMFFFLALLSKESAVPLLALIPISIYCFRPLSSFRKSVGISSLSLVVAFTVFMLIRQSILGWGTKPVVEDNILNNSFMYANGISERYGTTFYTLWMYFRLLLVPHPLTIDYYPFYIPYIGLADLRSILPMLLYGGLTILAILLSWRKHVAGFGLLFFLIGLFPVSNLLFIVGPFMGERLVFIPSVGFIIAFTWVIIKGAERMHRSHLLPYVFSFLLLAYTVRTLARNTDWKDSYTLYTRDVKTSVNSAVITKGAGHEILLRAEAANDPSVKKAYAQQAIPYLEQAVKLNKSTTETFLLGNAYYENGEFEKALGMYLETLALSSDYKKARTNYFIAANRLKPPSLKIRYYELFMLKTGASYDAFYQKGLVFGKELNQPDSSISNLIRATAMDSTKVDCLSDLGVALAIKGEYDKSAFYLEKALRINPNDSRIRQNLILLYRNKGNHSRADALSGK